jgi:low affinity Fe/Cu permease
MLFTHFAKWTAHITGRPAVFCLAVLTVLVWGVSGPFFGFSDTWQLVINTGTTIVTFLMVFLIQNTQNRDSEAVQLKLDELICAAKEARNSFLDLEELSEDELEKIRKTYLELAEKARKELRDKNGEETE